VVSRGALVASFVVLLVASGAARAAHRQPNHAAARLEGWPVLSLSPEVQRQLAPALAHYPAMALEDARRLADERGEVIVALVAEHAPISDPDAFQLHTVFPQRHGPIETPEGHRFGTSIPFEEMTFTDFLDNIVWLQLDRPERLEVDGRRVFRYEFQGIPEWSGVSPQSELAAMAADPACYVGEAILHLLDETEIPLAPDRWRFRHYQTRWSLEVQTLTNLSGGLPLVVAAHATGPDCIPPSVPGGHSMDVVESVTFARPGNGWPGRCLFRVEGEAADGRPVAVELGIWKVGRPIPLEVPALVAVCAPAGPDAEARPDANAGFLYRAYAITDGRVTLEDGTEHAPSELVAPAAMGGGQ